MYFIQHCFICRTSDSTVSQDARIEPWTVATLALVVCSGSASKNLSIFNPKNSVLRIRIRDPVPFWPLDPVFSGIPIPDLGSGIPNPYVWELGQNFWGKNFNNSLKIGLNFFLQHLKKKKMFRNSRKYDPGFSSRLRIPDPDLDFFLPIPDPGSRGQKAPHPGSGPATLVYRYHNIRGATWQKSLMKIQIFVK